MSSSNAPLPSTVTTLTSYFHVEELPRVQNLCAVIDPDTEPYRSRYSARESLEKWAARAEEVIRDSVKKKSLLPLAHDVEGDDEGVHLLRDALAAAHSKLGELSLETEETTAGEAHLAYALGWLALRSGEAISVVRRAPWAAASTPLKDVIALGVPRRSGVIIPDTDDGDKQLIATTTTGSAASIAVTTLFLSSAGQMALLHSGWDNHARALAILRTAKRIYNRVRASIFKGAEGGEGVGTASIEPKIVKALAVLDIEYTHTCFYLAQVYGHLGKPAPAARYAERTLARQLAVLGGGGGGGGGGGA